jgi:hypothetical protein
MIRLSLVVSSAALAFAGTAQAQCSCNGNAQLKNPALAAALAGKTVCVGSAPTWQSQEQHTGGPTSGDLVDYKRGPNDKIDPSEKVGTWSVSGNGGSSSVTYSYTGGGTYKFQACSAGGNSIGFCPDGSARSTVNATVKASIGACP